MENNNNNKNTYNRSTWKFNSIPQTITRRIAFLSHLYSLTNLEREREREGLIKSIFLKIIGGKWLVCTLANKDVVIDNGCNGCAGHWAKPVDPVVSP